MTDVDNVYSRHVPLHGFLDEGYDVYHSYEMWYPTDIASKFGFVVNGGHIFLRSSPETIRFMELVIKNCDGKCDDQVAYNRVFFYDLNVTWDGGIGTPNHARALRINAPHTENDGLLVQSVTGRSSITNHTIKIWDRDFAWRVSSSSGGGGGLFFHRISLILSILANQTFIIVVMYHSVQVVFPNYVPRRIIGWGCQRSWTSR